MPFVSIPEALDEIRRGRIFVVVADEDRENAGDLTIAADNARFAQTGCEIQPQLGMGR